MRGKLRVAFQVALMFFFRRMEAFQPHGLRVALPRPVRIVVWVVDGQRRIGGDRAISDIQPLSAALVAAGAFLRLRMKFM